MYIYVHLHASNLGIEIDEFPGGPDGFELVSRFRYNHGTISITISNVSLLHCFALFLGMTEKVSPCNLLEQTETFLEGMFYWSWNSSGVVQKLMCSLHAKIAQNSDVNGFFASSSSSSDTTFGFRLLLSFFSEKAKEKVVTILVTKRRQ
ncbi:hypothetical protein RJ639_039782 [Escallonia herrerae]|uniref:Uncharacterized protein n=1 Tax=Escallonia herrerae TaxID=1293975 RepID=A0AA88WLU5_9ASTE|nr:hypothetical protein RJ639_039782 [Escallonia herrerae]